MHLNPVAIRNCAMNRTVLAKNGLRHLEGWSHKAQFTLSASPNSVSNPHSTPSPIPLCHHFQHGYVSLRLFSGQRSEKDAVYPMRRFRTPPLRTFPKSHNHTLVCSDIVSILRPVYVVGSRRSGNDLRRGSEWKIPAKPHFFGVFDRYDFFHPVYLIKILFYFRRSEPAKTFGTITSSKLKILRL